MDNFFLHVNKSGEILNFPVSLKFNFIPNSSLTEYFDDKSISFLLSDIAKSIEYKVKIKGKAFFTSIKKYFFYTIEPLINENVIIYFTDIPEYVGSENTITNITKTINIVNQILLEFSSLDDNVNEYIFLGEKLRDLFPQCTIILNRYIPENELFYLEYFYSSYDFWNNYVHSLSNSLNKISFSLPYEQRILANYGKLIELKKEDFLAANYFFNKDLLKEELLKVYIENIYIIGLLGSSSILGNVTIIVHNSGIDLSLIEPICQNFSLHIQKKQAKNEISKYQKFYQLIFNSVNQVIIVIDDNDKILFINQPASELLSKFNVNTDVINKDIKTILTFLNNNFKQNLEKAKKNRNHCSFEVYIYFSNTFYAFQVDITPLNFYDTKTYFAVLIKDITDLIISQRQLDEITELNNIIVENLSQGIILIDENYKVIKFNKCFLELFKLSPDKIINKTIFELIAPEFKNKAHELINKLSKENKSFSHEFIFDDKVFKEELFPIKRNNDINYFVSIVTDITEEKKKEEEIKTEKNKLEIRERFKTNYLITVNHELRTLVNSIHGFTNLLLTESMSESKKLNYLRRINQTSHELARLIDDLTDISLLELGKIKIFKETIFLYNFLKNIYEQFLFELEIKQRDKVKLIFANSPEDDLPFFTDGLRLKQIISNLLSNSIKYTFNGEISFGYTLMNNCIVFYVKDTGIGFDVEEVFSEKFELKENIDIRKSSGIGLKIVRELVDLLNGELFVESIKNIGSTFSVKFEYLYPNFLNTISELDESNELTLNEDLNILIAEDDDFNFLFLKEMLESDKVKVIRANNGKEAIEVYKNNIDKIDLILMDIKMPIIDGIAATKIIKKINKNIPIIAQTAFAYSAEEKESREAGCSDYIIKPINKRELIAKIKKYLNKKV